MEVMGVDARSELMERLDECLKNHAARVLSQDIASIYNLWGLAEMHCYLKTEHLFTPEEIDALLQFQDPLEVAMWCKEDNPHKHRFPICELLDIIGASERFPLAEDNHIFEDTFARFREVITKNYYSFRDKVAGWTPERVFDNAERIAAVTKTYRDLMTDYTPVLKEILVVLQYPDPLQIIAQLQPYRSIGSAMEIICDGEDLLPIYDKESAQELISLHDRLEKAKREVDNRPEKAASQIQEESR